MSHHILDIRPEITLGSVCLWDGLKEYNACKWVDDVIHEVFGKSQCTEEGVHPQRIIRPPI